MTDYCQTMTIIILCRIIIHAVNFNYIKKSGQFCDMSRSRSYGYSETD